MAKLLSEWKDSQKRDVILEISNQIINERKKNIEKNFLKIIPIQDILLVLRTNYVAPMFWTYDKWYLTLKK